MLLSLDTPTISTLKAEARALRDERQEAGTPLSHGAALEEVAHRHGYRDWNTASAALPDRTAVPLQVGQRAEGTYLGHPFTGLVLGMEMLPDMQHYRISVKFDQPIDVWKGDLAQAFRQRVSATVDQRGITPAKTSDGQPHMRIRRI